MKKDFSIAIALLLISLPFLYVYCYKPIVDSPPAVSPKECFSKSMGVGVIRMVHRQLSSAIYNQLTSSQQNKINNNAHFFDKLLVVSKHYTTIEHVNRNNGSISCNATFDATMTIKDGKTLKTTSSGTYTLAMGSDGEVYSVPDAISNSLMQGLNNDMNNG